MKQGYDFSKIKRIAVIEFRDSPNYPNSGSIVSQLFAKYLLMTGFNIIERDQLDAILKEHNLQMTNLMDTETMTQFKLLGIDAIVTGSIPMVVAEQNFYDAGRPRFIAAEVGVTVRMISVATGEVLWIGSDTNDSTDVQTAFEYLVSSLVKQLSQDLIKAQQQPR
jgi:curli biogenesis system outer membrane secretion channel CsgG